MKQKQIVGIVLALTAGFMWGVMGVFVRYLSALGLGSMEIGQIRITVACVAVGIYLIIWHREKFSIRLRDLWCFVGSGVGSIMMFCYIFFMSMQYLPLSVASILCYTAPVFVTLLSALMFKEKITKRTILALTLALAGCALVSGIGSGGNLSSFGVFLGVLSGFIFALYSLFSRFAINRGYSAWTITFYSFLLCALVGAFFCDWDSISVVIAEPTHWPWALGLGIISGFAPYVLYSLSLECLKGSVASVLITVDPVVATIVSVVLFREPFGFAAVIGIVLVLSAVILLSMKKE